VVVGIDIIGYNRWIHITTPKICKCIYISHLGKKLG